MNKIRAIQSLNKRELENGISPEASWHVDYRDTAFIYFGGLPYDISEGDVITIFSQFGEPVFLKLARDQETGKSKGFGWLKYEDQRSTDLAVDNLGGAQISGRTISVDHARYKPRDDEDPEEGRVDWATMMKKEGKSFDTAEEDEDDEDHEDRNILPEEKELALLIRNHDDEDPMKAYLVDEKRKEVDAARLKDKGGSEKRSRKHKHRHHRSHRSGRHGSEEDRRENREAKMDRRYDRDPSRRENPTGDFNSGHDEHKSDSDTHRDSRDRKERHKDHGGRGGVSAEERSRRDTGRRRDGREESRNRDQRRGDRHENYGSKGRRRGRSHSP